MNPVATFSTQPYAPSAPKAAAPSRLDRIQSLRISAGMLGTLGGATLVTEASSLPYGSLAAFVYEISRGIETVTIAMEAPGAASIPMFSGVLDEVETNLGTGRVTMHMRDLGAALQERSVEPRAFAPDTTVEDAIFDITEATGVPVAAVAAIQDSNGQPLKVGTFYKGHNYFVSQPEPAWGILHHLARKTHNVVYITPGGALYFGPRNRYLEIGATIRQLTWSASGYSDFLALGLTHIPFRHGAFIQTVGSHDRKNGTQCQGAAAYINPSLSLDVSGGPLIAEPIKETAAQLAAGQLVVAVPKYANLPGIYAGITVPEIVAASGNLPVYATDAASMSPDECTLDALSRAQETAAQEITLSGEVLGTQFLTPGTAFVVSGTGHPLVDGEMFVVVHVETEFDVGSLDGIVPGFTQSFEAWRSDRQVSGIEGGFGEGLRLKWNGGTGVGV